MSDAVKKYNNTDPPYKKAMELIRMFKPHAKISTEGTIITRIQNAKACAIIYCNEILEIIESLHKPEYTAFLLKEKYAIETEYDTHIHGYELKTFYESVLSILKTL